MCISFDEIVTKINRASSPQTSFDNVRIQRHEIAIHGQQDHNILLSIWQELPQCVAATTIIIN